MSVRQTGRHLLSTLKIVRGRKQLDPSSSLIIDSEAPPLWGGIVMGRDSELMIEAGVTIEADLVIGDNCKVIFRRQSKLRNSIFSVTNGSTVDIGEGAIIDSPVSQLSSITVDNGTLRLEQRAHVMSSDLLVRFGGKMSIGRYTGIAYRSEIRCEEQVDIGSYGMISYGVCIYDTNTHSIDWRERRERIEQCYPGGVREETRPKTKPVFIGDDVWIGKEVTITKGARIGNRCIIGIRTVVGNETVDDDSVVVAGKPRIIAKRQALST